MPFAGFPQEALRFFAGLKKNNNREWFQARKSIFEQSVKAPMEQFVDALNASLLKYAPMYITEPRKAIYRIYRDTRFSKDKTPYKDHIAASFIRMGMEKHVSAGYYVSVGAAEIEVAAGIYMPGPDQLRLVRNHIAANHEEFREIAANRKLRQLLGDLWGEPSSRTPKGFDKEHPADDLIRYKQWVFYDTRLDPALATTPRFVPEISKRFEAVTPFVEFLNRPLTVKKAAHP